MADEFGDKTQEASPHRRQQARDKGMVPRSQDLSSAVLLLVGLVGLLYFGDGLVRFFATTAQHFLGDAPQLQLTPQEAVSTTHGLLWQLAPSLLPLFGLLLASAVMVHLAQSGFLFLPDKVGFDWQHVNPLTGWKRIFSMANFVRLAFGLLKLTLVVSVAAYALSSDVGRVLSLSNLEPQHVAVVLVEIALWTSIKIASALVILALLDYLFQWWKYEQDLKMTREEIVEEFKEQHGDPQTINRRKQIQRQLVMNRARTAVPKADVVVTNPTELAVALQYDPTTMPAPVVVAKGAGALAQRIRRLALENGVPIVERKELARFLYKHVDVNQAVPVDQYAPVAEVLRYVYELKGKKLPAIARGAA